MEKVIADLMEKRNKAVKPEEAMLWEAYSMPRCDIEELKEKIATLEKDLVKALRINDLAVGFVFRCANDTVGDWYFPLAKGVFHEIEKIKMEGLR